MADVLRQRILSGAIPDGGTMPELDDLTAEFGASKLPVRQACHVLETEGLPEVRRGDVGGGVARVPRPGRDAW